MKKIGKWARNKYFYETWEVGNNFFLKEFLQVIKKAVNSPAPRTGKTGKHSTAQTRNYLYLLLTIFLLRQLFSCPCFPKLLQTWHTAEAVFPSKSGVLGRGTSALGKVAMQTESPTSLGGREALPGGVHSSIPSCAAPQTSMTAL